MSQEQFATGACQCGQVKYTINAEPLRMAQCHCKGCQRTSGGGHMSLAFFPEDAVEISGATGEYGSVADSGNTNTRIFCTNCGSRLFGKNSARAGMIAVTAGSVDDNSWFEPGAAVYASERPLWDTIDPEMMTFDQMPPAPK